MPGGRVRRCIVQVQTRGGAAARGRERVREARARLLFGSHLAGWARRAPPWRGRRRERSAPLSARRRRTQGGRYRACAVGPRPARGLAADYLAALHCRARFLRLIFFGRRARAPSPPVCAGARECAPVARQAPRATPGSRAACIACRAAPTCLFSCATLQRERTLPARLHMLFRALQHTVLTQHTARRWCRDQQDGG